MDTKLIVRILAFALAVIMGLGCFLIPAIAATTEIVEDDMGFVSNKACSFDADFDALYTYEGDDLGANWSKERTFFRLWAPLPLTFRSSCGNPAIPKMRQYATRFK